jgi:hypothetical protein
MQLTTETTETQEASGRSLWRRPCKDTCTISGKCKGIQTFVHLLIGTRRFFSPVPLAPRSHMYAGESGREDFFPLSPSLLTHTCTQVHRDGKIFFPFPPHFSLTHAGVSGREDFFPFPPRSSLTHARRCIRTGRFFSLSPFLLTHTCTQVHRSPRFSLTHALRCIGPHNATSPMTTPLMYCIVLDNSTSFRNKEYFHLETPTTLWWMR